MCASLLSPECRRPSRISQQIRAEMKKIRQGAQSLAQCNTELANLERATGTILETHAVQFYEERFAAMAPLGRLAKPELYPSGLLPGPNTPVYPEGKEPAENFFDLKAPAKPD